MIRAILPYPVLALGVFISSLLMSGSVGAPSIALAVLLALSAPQVMRAMRTDPVRLKAPGQILVLFVLVSIDILRSNMKLIQQLLTEKRRERTPGYLVVQLELQDRYGIAFLAAIVTATSGTLWLEYDSATGRLLLHLLDMSEADMARDEIKHRYERRLKAIFE